MTTVLADRMAALRRGSSVDYPCLVQPIQLRADLTAAGPHLRSLSYRAVRIVREVRGQEFLRTPLTPH